MKQKGEEFFSLLVVVTCVFASALLLRTLFDHSITSHANEIQIHEQEERIHTPLQTMYADESSAMRDMKYKENATPDPKTAYPETGGYRTGDLTDYPMGDETYLAGFNFSEQADRIAIEACYTRYEGYSLSVTKAYLESPYSRTGYAWYGVVQMEEDIPVIFHYSELTDIWTMRSGQSGVYYFFDEQTDDSKEQLQTITNDFLEEWMETGYVDWNAYG